MESFLKNVAANFDISLSETSREKFGILGKTAAGQVVMLQKFQDVPENLQQIRFVHEIKQHLLKNNFNFTANFLISNIEKAPYFKHGGDVFTAIVLDDASVANFGNDDIFLKIIENLAKMHKILKGVKFEATPKKRQNTTPSPEKAAASLSGFKKKMMRAGKFSEFDMLFLKVYEIFQPHMAAWANLPKDFMISSNYICHNLLKEESIYFDESPIFVNFSCASYGHYLNDLVYIIKRYLKQAGPSSSVLPLDKILTTYLSHNAEENFDTAHFKSLLLYPDKFIKLSKDYYSKNRNFAPKTYISRIEECFVRGEAMLRYLDLQTR